MNASYPKHLFERIYQRLINDHYSQYDQNSKLMICRNLAKCLVEEKFEHLLAKIIMKCLENDSKTHLKKQEKIEVDDEDLEKPSIINI